MASQQFVESVGEELHAIVDKLVGDFLHRDAGLVEVRMVFGGGIDVFGQAGAQLAVIAEGIEGGRRNRVDGVGADQLFDVEHVAIVGILGAGAGPQQALRLRALGRESLPARVR